MKRLICFLLALETLTPVVPGAAQSSIRVAASPSVRSRIVRIPVRPDSRIWLEGGSNVRDWTCKATSLEASIDIEQNTASIDGRAVRGVAVKVPVRMLKCGDRHMEAHLYTALKAAEPPEVSYIVASFESIPLASSATQVESSGQLMVAGVQRWVKMTVRADRLPDGSYRARGTVPILMTDFGIKPPRPWGGILRTDNEVLIQFEIFVDPID